MLIPFEKLPESARIWIYQSDKFLDDGMIAKIEEEASTFLDQWQAHGAPLHSSVSILHNRFLVIGVDESAQPVTGCSTDASVNFIRSLGTALGIDFFNRMQMPLLLDDSVALVELSSFRKKELPSQVTAGTFTFDNLISEKGQLENDWMKPVGDTWLAKYL